MIAALATCVFVVLTLFAILSLVACVLSALAAGMNAALGEWFSAGEAGAATVALLLLAALLYWASGFFHHSRGFC